jgi:hypothetical protein
MWEGHVYAGVEKMRTKFNWESITRCGLEDYKATLMHGAHQAAGAS